VISPRVDARAVGASGSMSILVRIPVIDGLRGAAIEGEDYSETISRLLRLIPPAASPQSLGVSEVPPRRRAGWRSRKGRLCGAMAVVDGKKRKCRRGWGHLLLPHQHEHRSWNRFGGSWRWEEGQ
jgi:hypothetical protein